MQAPNPPAVAPPANRERFPVSDEAPVLPVSFAIHANGAKVEFQFSTPVNLYAISFTPEQAEAMADELPNVLRDAAKQCKQNASGLVVANTIPKE